MNIKSTQTLLLEVVGNCPLNIPIQEAISICQALNCKAEVLYSNGRTVYVHSTSNVSECVNSIRR